MWPGEILQDVSNSQVPGPVLYHVHIESKEINKSGERRLADSRKNVFGPFFKFKILQLQQLLQTSLNLSGCDFSQRKERRETFSLYQE